MPVYYFRAAYRSSTFEGIDVVNGFHFAEAKLSSPFDPVDAANEIDTKLTTAYKAMLTTGDTVHDLTVTQVGVPDTDVVQSVKSLEVLGTRAAGSRTLDPALCMVSRLTTATPKRFARGRFWAPPAMDSAQTVAPGSWTTGTYRTNVNTFATLLTATWTAGSDDFTPIIWSDIQFQRGEDFAFPITGKGSDLKQHFLRSRSSVHTP